MEATGMSNRFDEIYDRVGTACVKYDSDPRYSSGEVIPMWVADMDFPAPDAVVEALKKRACHPFYTYTHDNGDFTRVTAEWVKRRLNWDVEAEWIAFSPSVLSSLAMSVHALTQEEDQIIIMPPVYFPFRSFITGSHRRVLNCPLLCEEGHYRIDFDLLESCAAQADVSMLILCNPHNPVGRVFTREELKRVAEICVRHHVFIFSDEIHSDLILDNNTHVPIADVSKEAEQITVTGLSVSKTFNLSSLHASSFVAPNPEIREKILAVRETWGLGNISCFAYEGYKAAYQYGDRYVDELCAYLTENRFFAEQFFSAYIPEITVSPLEGTYLMWLDCRGLGMTEKELEDFFWNEVKIGVDFGPDFGPGGEGHVRMLIACPRTVLKEALCRLRDAVMRKEKGNE